LYENRKIRHKKDGSY